MAKRVVVHAPGAMSLRPRQREVACGIDGRRIEPQEDGHVRARVLTKRVELFTDGKARAKAGRRRMRLILDDDRRRLWSRDVP